MIIHFRLFTVDVFTEVDIDAGRLVLRGHELIEGCGHAFDITIVKSCHEIGLPNIEVGKSMDSPAFLGSKAETFFLVAVIEALKLVFKFPSLNFCDMLKSKPSFLGVCHIELNFASLLNVDQPRFLSPNILERVHKDVYNNRTDDNPEECFPSVLSEKVHVVLRIYYINSLIVQRIDSDTFGHVFDNCVHV